MWSGMAFRMGTDLGVDDPTFEQSEDHQYLLGILRMQDAIMAIGSELRGVIIAAKLTHQPADPACCCAQRTTSRLPASCQTRSSPIRSPMSYTFFRLRVA